MNAICFAPLALLESRSTAPLSRQWHALHLADGYALAVIDFLDDEARDAFFAQAGVEPWPDLDMQPNAPLTPTQAARLSGAPLAMATKLPGAGRPAIAALEDIRLAGWPMARRRF